MCQFMCKWFFVQLHFHCRAYTYTQAYKSLMKTACVRALLCVCMVSTNPRSLPAKRLFLSEDLSKAILVHLAQNRLHCTSICWMFGLQQHHHCLGGGSSTRVPISSQTTIKTAGLDVQDVVWLRFLVSGRNCFSLMCSKLPSGLQTVLTVFMPVD